MPLDPLLRRRQAFGIRLVLKEWPASEADIAATPDLADVPPEIAAEAAQLVIEAMEERYEGLREYVAIAMDYGRLWSHAHIAGAVTATDAVRNDLEDARDNVRGRLRRSVRPNTDFPERVLGAYARCAEIIGRLHADDGARVGGWAISESEYPRLA